LTLLVGLAVLGCVLNGSITVLVSTLMNIRAKTFEIGILRAHGFRDGEVMAVFLLQAVILGTLALAVATAAVYLAEPIFRELFCGALEIRTAAFATSSLFARSARWLFAVAAGICL
jgi:ABC-type antimicrobial peptide transport system permease subunit